MRRAMIRRATEADVPHILRCIRELARYEKLEHECDVDARKLGDGFLCGP